MSQRNSTRRTQRQEILASAGLAGASRVLQSVFWQRYNCERARRRLPATLGELTATAWPESATARDAATRRVDAAWQRVLPAQYADSAKVETFRAGRLQIRVDSAATRYVLERQLNGILLNAINAELGSSEVVRIDYQLGRTTDQKTVTTGSRMRPRGQHT